MIQSLRNLSGSTRYSHQQIHPTVCSAKMKLLAVFFMLLITAALNGLTAFAATTDKTKTNKSVKITISAAGDCTLGVDSRYNNTFNDYYKKKGSAYFLKKVKKVFSKDDVTIVNLEGPFTNATNRASKTFTFKGPASYAKILKKGSVEVVNVANNHSFDYGKKGYSDTLKTLKKNNIKYCRNSSIAYKTVKGVKIAFLGFNKLEGITSSDVKKVIQKAKRQKAKIIIVSFHWGIEKDYYPISTQKSIAHDAIRYGATLVLGHHPHVLQGIERYRGRYIVYSLGNFCFGGNTNPSDKDTMIFQQTFTIKNGKVEKNKDVKVIPCSLSSSPNRNDFQPKILTGKSKKRVLKKINNLSKGMGVNFK
ncbi:MAG: CapA family protein [Clostridium sp.]|nr:CapA family protein [Clostridium sp.]